MTAITVPALTTDLGDVEMPEHAGLGEIVEIHYDAVAYYGDAPAPVVIMDLWGETPEQARRVRLVRGFRYGVGVAVLDQMTNRPVAVDAAQREVCGQVWDAVSEVYRRVLYGVHRAVAPVLTARFAAPVTGQDAPVRTR